MCQVQKLLMAGHRQVVDADLSGYFDSIPHAELLKTLARRISDGAMMQALKLRVNEIKTRVCLLREEYFDFLGYTFGRLFSPRTGRAYLGVRPGKKRILRICRQVWLFGEPSVPEA